MGKSNSTAKVEYSSLNGLAMAAITRKNAERSSSRCTRTAMLSGMVSVSIGFIHSRYKRGAGKSGMVMLFLMGFRNGPPSLPLVPPKKNQPDSGGPHPGLLVPFLIHRRRTINEDVNRKCF